MLERTVRNRVRKAEINPEVLEVIHNPEKSRWLLGGLVSEMPWISKESMKQSSWQAKDVKSDRA